MSIRYNKDMSLYYRSCLGTEAIVEMDVMVNMPRFEESCQYFDINNLQVGRHLNIQYFVKTSYSYKWLTNNKVGNLNYARW